MCKHVYAFVATSFFQPMLSEMLHAKPGVTPTVQAQDATVLAENVKQHCLPCLETASALVPEALV